MGLNEDDLLPVQIVDPVNAHRESIQSRMKHGAVFFFIDDDFLPVFQGYFSIEANDGECVSIEFETVRLFYHH